MKKLTLLTAMALACCPFTSAFAQVQILRSVGPTLAPKLVSDQTELDSLDALDSQPVAREAIPNPFDYFAEQLPQVPAPSELSDDSQDSLTGEQSLLDASPSNNFLAPQSSSPSASSEASDTTSLPVGRHHRVPSIVDTIVDQATVGNVPHCATTPVVWGGMTTTPNPVADWLLRQECVDGLWASYPQQRAAECAQMWAHLQGIRPVAMVPHAPSRDLAPFAQNLTYAAIVIWKGFRQHRWAAERELDRAAAVPLAPHQQHVRLVPALMVRPRQAAATVRSLPPITQDAPGESAKAGALGVAQLPPLSTYR